MLANSKFGVLLLQCGYLYTHYLCLQQPLGLANAEGTLLPTCTAEACPSKLDKGRGTKMVHTCCTASSRAQQLGPLSADIAVLHCSGDNHRAASI